MNTYIATALIFTSLQSPANTEDPLPIQGKSDVVTEQKVTNPDIISVLTGILKNKLAPENKKIVVNEEEEANKKFINAIKIHVVNNYEDLNPSWKESVHVLGPKVYQKYEKYIRQASKEFDVPTDLITAIIITESLGDPDAISRKQAKGLMQTRSIIDGETGVYGDSFDPETSIRKGTAYLAVLKNKYGMEDAKMLVAYNEGPTRTKKFAVDEIAEHNYFQKISYIMENVL